MSRIPIPVPPPPPDAPWWLRPPAVTAAPGTDPAAVRALPLPRLYALRELVNTAIYDAERGGTAPEPGGTGEAP
jgi:hypothetical protein